MCSQAGRGNREGGGRRGGEKKRAMKPDHSKLHSLEQPLFFVLPICICARIILKSAPRPFPREHVQRLLWSSSSSIPSFQKRHCVVYIKKGQAAYSQVTLKVHLLRYPKLLSEAGIWVDMYVYVHIYMCIYRYTHTLYFASLHT